MASFMQEPMTSISSRLLSRIVDYDYIKLLGMLFKCSSSTIGFPKYSKEELDERYKLNSIAKLKPNRSFDFRLIRSAAYTYETTEMSEPDRCQNVQSRPILIRLLFIMVYVSLIVRHVYFILYSIENARNTTISIKSEWLLTGIRPDSLSNYSSNLNTTMRSIVYAYGCLRTNCSQLRKNGNLLDDLVSLPVFSLCHENLKYLYPPVISIHAPGIILSAVTACFYIAAACVAPIILQFVPHQTGLMIFFTAPNIIIRSNCLDLQQFLKKMHFSAINYYRNINIDLQNNVHLESRKTNYARLTHQVSYIKQKKQQQANINIPTTSDLENEIFELKRLDRDYEDLDLSTRAFIEDCLPISRTNWWSRISARQICLFISLLLFNGVYSVFVAGIYVNYLLRVGREHFVEIKDSIKDSGCIVWMHDESSNGNRIRHKDIDIADALIGWNFVSLSEIALVLFLLVQVQIMVGYAAGTLQEINYRIDELIDRIELATVSSEIFRQFNEVNCSIASAIKREVTPEVAIIKRTSIVARRSISEFSGHDFKLEPLRREQKKNLRIYFGYIYLKSLRETRLATDEYGQSREQSSGHDDYDQVDTVLSKIIVEQLVENNSNADLYLSLMIKTYMSARNLMEFVKTERNFTFLVPVTYALSYSQVIIIPIILDRLDHEHNLTLVVGLLGIFVTNALVSLPSATQIKSKKLISRIWRLIATTTHIRNLRIKHLRHLWLKQAVSLCQSNGITASVFNIQITYSNVIQVVVWSSTFWTLLYSR